MSKDFDVFGTTFFDPATLDASQIYSMIDNEVMEARRDGCLEQSIAIGHVQGYQVQLVVTRDEDNMHDQIQPGWCDLKNAEGVNPDGTYMDEEELDDDEPDEDDGDDGDDQLEDEPDTDAPTQEESKP